MNQHLRVLLCSLALLALGACAASPTRQLDKFKDQVTQANQLVERDEYARADAILKGVLAAASFPTLPAELRHLALQLSALVALQVDDPKRALALLQRSSAMNEADSDDGYLRVLVANAAHDHREAAAALIAVAVRWPQALAQLEPDRALGRAMRSLDEVGSEADRYTVLNALFKAPLTEQHDDDSDWWRDLALMRLEHADLDGARNALLRIKDAYVAIGVEADKRYDPIREHLDAWPGVAAIAGRTIDTVLKRAQDNPANLEYMVRLADLLGESLRFEHELQVADTAVEQVEAEGKKAYSDYADWYLWILNARAYALFGLGRWDAAIVQEQVASKEAEAQGPNVSQVINLAGMYARADKPQEALATLKRLQAGSSSTFGDMQTQEVRVIAAIQLHDDATVTEALAFMRQHQDVAVGALEEALVSAGRDDEAAQLLISRLDDVKRRAGALLAVQQYDERVLTPWQLQLTRRWQAVVGRADVQAAIARVGRVGHYPIDREEF